MIAGIVLAAGAGRRFGGPKQLASFRGRPLLEHALATIARSAVDQAVVVLGAEADRILHEIDLHGVRPVLCSDWESGQAASLRAGVGAVRGADAAVVTLGDQPLISADAIDQLIARRSAEADALRAGYAGEPGHPVLLERPLLDRVEELRGDAGARGLLSVGRVRTVPCDGLGSPVDVDTPEQLGELEAAPGSHAVRDLS